MVGHIVGKIVFLVLLTSGTSFAGKADEKCKEYSQLFKDKIVPSQLTATKNPSGKVPTSPGEFPHVVALGYGTEKDIQWLCGGSLISDEYVLTSGVCAASSGEPVKFVRIGDHNIRSKTDDKDAQQFTISKIIKHPDFKTSSNYNDIALLKLSSKVKMTKSARPACLYTTSTLPTGAKTSVAGWGKVDNNGVAIDTLMKVYLDQVNNKDCSKVYETSKKRLKDGVVEKLLICAGGTTKFVCKGDTGSPLQMLNKDQNNYEIVGISSFGNSCGSAKDPPVFTRVSAFVPWIESIVWETPKKN